MVYINDINGFFLIDQKKILFRFSQYGCWEISEDLQFEDKPYEVCATYEANRMHELCASNGWFNGIRGKNELAIDVIEHRVYAPRVHYFVFYLPSPFLILKDLYIIVKYDGSCACVESFNVFTSLTKARRYINEDSVGLKRRV